MRFPCLLRLQFRRFLSGMLSADLFRNAVFQGTHMIFHLYIFLLQDLNEFLIIYPELFRKLMYPHFCHILTTSYMQYPLGF